MIINRNIDVGQKSILTFEIAAKTDKSKRGLLAPVICLLLVQKATVPPY